MDMKELNDKKNQWTKNNKDRILLLLPKGMKGQIKEYAKFKGISVNAAILECINDSIQRDLTYRQQSKEETEIYNLPWD